jgi:hypothetical protein
MTTERPAAIAHIVGSAGMTNGRDGLRPPCPAVQTTPSRGIRHVWWSDLRLGSHPWSTTQPQGRPARSSLSSSRGTRDGPATRRASSRDPGHGYGPPAVQHHLQSRSRAAGELCPRRPRRPRSELCPWSVGCRAPARDAAPPLPCREGRPARLPRSHGRLTQPASGAPTAGACTARPQLPHAAECRRLFGRLMHCCHQSSRPGSAPS